MLRLLIALGFVILLLWLVRPWLKRLGQLPGDFVIRRGDTTIHIPLVTWLIVAAALALFILLLKR
jgi:hypothetical protein